MGRTLEVQKSIVGATGRTMNWTYDYAGRVQRLTYPHTEASPLFYVDYGFHPGASLLHTVTGSDGTVYATMTGYQPSGKMGVLDYGNNVRTTYGYDGWSQRLTSIYTAGDQGTGDRHQDRLYYYSKAGDIEQIDDQAWIETYYYSYDKLHRLTSETTSSGSVGVMPGIYEMQYDNPGHIHAASSVTTCGAAYDYAYDSNGNMTAGPDVSDSLNVVQRSLTFNGDNMPATVVHPRGGTVNLTYDGEGKRAKKTGPNGTTYYFTNEFEQIGATQTCYIFAGNQRVAQVKDYTNVTYFHKDHLGSSSVITAANGSAEEQTRYMPFGGQRGEGSGITVSAYKFTDQELDGESGLYNYDARMYDPALGQFLSADILVPDFYDPQAWNRYAYVSNNPLLYNDPSGHYWEYDGGGGYYPQVGPSEKANIERDSVLDQIAACYGAEEDGYIGKQELDFAHFDYSEKYGWTFVKKAPGSPTGRWTDSNGDAIDHIILPDSEVVPNIDRDNALRDVAASILGIKSKSDSTKLSSKEAAKAAKKLGYEKTNYKSHGQPVFRKGNKYITPDVDSHVGGVWKMADSVKNLGSKATRMGTYDANLNHIGP